MPILSADTLEIISRDADQTRRIGGRLGALLRTGDMLYLHGDLGTGKTTFVQGLAHGWGSLDPVTSPTFILVNVYRHTQREGNLLHHVDAYRLRNAADAQDLDLDLMLTRGPMVVEWAERVRAALPPPVLEITLNWVDDWQRDLLIVPHGARGLALTSALRRAIFGVD